MGLDNGEFADPSSISEALKCPICFDVFDEPVFNASGCQHSFCKSCVLPALRRQPTCPTCRGRMPIGSLRKHLMLTALLDELMVLCPHGCGWTGRRDARSHHVESCAVARLESAQQEICSLKRSLAERDDQSQQEICRLKRLLASREAQIDGIKVLRAKRVLAEEAAQQQERKREKLYDDYVDILDKWAEIHGDVPIFVKLINGRTVTFRINPADQVAGIKRRVLSMMNIPPGLTDAFYLTLNGKPLDEDAFAHQCRVMRESTLRLQVRQHAGSLQKGQACTKQPSVRSASLGQRRQGGRGPPANLALLTALASGQLLHDDELDNDY
eukprot:TRINITY_DN18995_c0_g1_i1.p1 TRINITY_DN18995_c0_g1~~TRINITY_DN18995_c0_g1_i1.p1  ORF type:complete len:353 (-),score=65.42 TRINITY_DN18995_c0_g1_i1:175-1155(-)